jgi:hypothetical protein
MIKTTLTPIAKSVEPVDENHVLAGEDTLKEMVKSFRDFLKKDRNLPQKGSKPYPIFQANAVQYICNIIELTTALIEQEVITEDPYGFLTANVTSFSFANKIINNDLIPVANEALSKKHAKEIADKEAQGETISTEEKELSPTQVAAIASEPTEDPNSHTIEILTTTKKRWYFDKVNFTLSFKKKDGSIKIIKLAKKGSWRASVISAFVKTISWIKAKYNDFKDRCVGIKQSIQFSWLRAKFNAKQKLEANKIKKAPVKTNNSLQNDFKDLPTNVV